MAVGLLIFAVLWALPIAALIWLVGASLGSVWIAHLMERTRGLEPTTYGGAFWLATMLTVVMVALEVRAIRRTSDVRRSRFVRFISHPSAAASVLLPPTYILVGLDLKGVDVPDIITTTLLLLCLGYLVFVLPLGLVFASWRLVRWMWQCGHGSGFMAGVLGTLGLLFGTCVPKCAADVADDAEDDRSSDGNRFEEIADAYERGLRSAEDADVLDGSLAVMGELSTVRTKDSEFAPSQRGRSFPFVSTPEQPRQSPALVGGDKDRFDSCMTLLHGDGRSGLRDKKITKFIVRYSMAQAEAADVVDDALLETCTRHLQKHYANVEAVFNRKADGRRINRYHAQQRRRACGAAVIEGLYRPTSPEWDEMIDFDDAICRLSEEEANLLQLFAEGHDANGLKEKLGLSSAAAVRQRKRRTLEKVRKLLH